MVGARGSRSDQPQPLVVTETNPRAETVFSAGRRPDTSTHIESRRVPVPRARASPWSAPWLLHSRDRCRNLWGARDAFCRISPRSSRCRAVSALLAGRDEPSETGLHVAQLFAGADVELGEDFAKVPFDGTGAEE